MGPKYPLRTLFKNSSEKNILDGKFWALRVPHKILWTHECPLIKIFNKFTFISLRSLLNDVQRFKFKKGSLKGSLTFYFQRLEDFRSFEKICKKSVFRTLKFLGKNFILSIIGDPRVLKNLKYFKYPNLVVKESIENIF